MTPAESQSPLAHLPTPRNRVPTIPFALEEYARWSCLPDGEDDIVFEAGPTVSKMIDRVPHVAALPDATVRLTRDETLLLSLVDGVSPVSLLVQLIGWDADLALVVLCDLFARGLVTFD